MVLIHFRQSIHLKCIWFSRRDHRAYPTVAHWVPPRAVWPALKRQRLIRLSGCRIWAVLTPKNIRAQLLRSWFEQLWFISLSQVIKDIFFNTFFDVHDVALLMLLDNWNLLVLAVRSQMDWQIICKAYGLSVWALTDRHHSATPVFSGGLDLENGLTERYWRESLSAEHNYFVYYKRNRLI